MEIVLARILQQLELLTITGKDAERMTAIKSMVRDLIVAIKESGIASEDSRNEKGENA